MKGTLTLIPTPIDDENPLEQKAFETLKLAVEKGDIIAVEEAKTCRRRWIHWGLPREAIQDFVLYNEHTRSNQASELLKELGRGKNVYLLSDCGLPAFCDPGRKLVSLCHEHSIKVTATPFPNSISLAMALSGFDHDRFIFEGFIPARGSERSKALKRILTQKEVSIIMDTPYRLQSLLKEMKEINGAREVFIGMNLNTCEERLVRGRLKEIKTPEGKHEFVLVVGGQNERK
ncbi:MAG: hypothetical protein CME64_12270 [Halobacteriovoraceae bacterium]|nr:hypothetical protein [Halobacteriovoraceae bacterium]